MNIRFKNLGLKNSISIKSKNYIVVGFTKIVKKQNCKKFIIKTLKKN